MSAAEPLDRARAVADDVLFPNAERADRAAVVPPSGLRALADAGLFGCAGPVASGGLALDPPIMRRVIATIGGACGATFFVWVQHHGVVRNLAGSGNDRLVDAWLTRMCTGEAIAGTAFAHLRRPGRPAIRATRRDAGWSFDGVAPWATSWGIADVFSISAVTDDGRVVSALVPGATGSGEPPGIESTPLRLPVLASTGTVALRFDDRRIDDADVIAVEDLAAWQAGDRLRSSIGQPDALGIAARAVDLLGTTADDGDARAARAALDAEIAAAWREDDRLVAEIARAVVADEGERQAVIAAASDHRAACLLLAQRATTALIAATGGRAMDLDHPGQRLGREAMFYTIQAQLGDGRAATLRRADQRGVDVQHTDPERTNPEHTDPEHADPERTDAAHLGLLTGIATTRAIRRIAPDPIPERDLSTILWHATRAPSGTNRQPARFVVLRDDAPSRQAKALLADAFRRGWQAKRADAAYDSGSGLDPASPKGRSRAAMEHFVEHFEEIPVVVLACLVRRRPPNPVEGASVYPACQNLLLAARALGYGGVLTQWHTFVEAELRDLLAIPEQAAISATIPLGRPLGSHGPVRRLPLADVVFDGRWEHHAGWATDPAGTRFAGPPPEPRA